MKYLVGLQVVGLLAVVAVIMAGYCLWLTTTSFSYAPDAADIYHNSFDLQYVS